MRRYHRPNYDDNKGIETIESLLEDTDYDNIVQDSFFGSLSNEKNWLHFNNNLRKLPSLHQTFVKRMHDDSIDKFLVAHS